MTQALNSDSKFVPLFACHFPFLFCPFSFTATGVGTNSAPNTLGQGASNHMSLSPNPPLRPSAPPSVQVTPATPSVDKKQARVLYDYDAADNSELNLLADEVAGFYLFYGDCVSAIFIIVVFLTSCGSICIKILYI